MAHQEDFGQLFAIHFAGNTLVDFSRYKHYKHTKWFRSDRNDLVGKTMWNGNSTWQSELNSLVLLTTYPSGYQF